MLLLAEMISVLVGLLALSAGAVVRGVALLIVAGLLAVAPRLNAGLATWLHGYRRRIVALVALGLAVLAVFWPTPLFIVDVMNAVPP